VRLCFHVRIHLEVDALQLYLDVTFALQLGESYDVSTTSPCGSSHGSASAVSGTTPRSSRGGPGLVRHGGHSGGSVERDAMAVNGEDAGTDDLDSMSVAGTSSIGCSRCSYVTGCDVSDSVSNVYAATAPMV